MSSAESVVQPSVVFTALAGVAAVKYTFAALVRWWHSQHFKIVGRVSSLNIFPVKSCAGYCVDTAECTSLGLSEAEVTDRHFMVIMANGDFLQQRTQPKMALIKVSHRGEDVEMNAPGMPSIKVSKHRRFDRAKVLPCRVWTARMEGMDCGDEVAEWLSTFLNTAGLRLLYSAPELPKQDMTDVTHKARINPAVPGDMAAFSDFGGYLVLSDNSMDALNERLDKPVTINNFRPNIVVKTDAAFQEDTWQEIKLGNTARMRMLDYCTRCSMTTVDPKTGVNSADGEPLKTLKSFRCLDTYGTSPCFGVNATIDVQGIVSVGDPVYAIRRKDL